MNHEELGKKVLEQVDKWEDQNTPIEQRISSLRQVRQGILDGVYPEILYPNYYIDQLIEDYEEQIRPENMKQVETSLMQIQNITSMYFHDQHVNLPTQNTKLQDQKKTYMMMKTLMARIHTQLYPGA